MNSNQQREKDEYSVFLKHLEEEKQETSNFAKIMLVIISILCGIVIGFLLLSDSDIVVGDENNQTEKSWFADFISKFSFKKREKQQFTMPLFTRRQTILLVGTDANQNASDPWIGTRTDTIILLNIDAKTKSVNAISVPRDSKVYIPHDHGVQKINAAHAIGGIDLTKEFAAKLGIATAKVLGKDKNITIAIGRDTRISGESIVEGLIEGLTKNGVNVIDLNVVPTPCVSFLVKKYNAKAGIMVSASHNPSEYNGIKIFDQNGFKLKDELEVEIENELYENNTTNYNKLGKVLEGYNPVSDYVNYLISTLDIDLSGLNVAIDCANGSASETAEYLFKILNCNYHIIHNNPNGKNINENCGSTHIESLKKYVIDNSLDCGIAYDGDADRCIMIDNNGNEIDGDYILAILANDLLKHNKLNNNTLVGTVMSNLGLTKFCEKNNINFVATKVGDRYVLEEMLKEGYNIGGEQSGHIILKDFANTGDGELTSIKILEIMKKENTSLEDLKKVMTKYPQILINVKVDNNKKHLLESDIEINECIKKLEGILNNDGRILIRPSGTEPLIRVMLEGNNIDKIKEYAYNIAKIIEDKLN